MTRQELFKRMNRHLGFDVDGVGADINTVAVRKLSATFGLAYKHDDVTRWDWVYEEALRLSLEKGYKPDSAKKIARDHRAVYFNSEALGSCDPYSGAILVFKWLELLGVPYDFITSRNPENREATIKWFSQHLPWVREERLHIRSDVQIEPDEFKLQEAKKIPVWLFFEDKPETAQHLLNGHVPTALVDRSWNRECVDLDKYRVRHGSIGIFTRALVFVATGR